MNSKKFNFNRNTSNPNPAPSISLSKSNNQSNVNPITTTTTSTTNNQMNNNDDDDDLLDISDTELIRASQVVESQLRFTNSNYHTTSNAMNIFSQFNTNNDGIMPPPSLPPTTIYSSSHNVDPFTQLEDTRNELKHIKSENLIKDGEVKILRDKLKRTEQEMQRIRIEKADLVKKLQLQQEEAKKALQKQIELKELENQIKSQEVVELTMKYKVLESTVKKNPPLQNKSIISSTPSPLSNALPSSTIMPSAINHSNQHQMSQSAVFDEAFSQNKKLMGPPINQSINSNNSINRKRLAPQVSTSSMSLSDNENENPIHENKRPNLVQSSVIKTPVITTPTTTAATTTTPTHAIRPPLSPFSSNSTIINPQLNQTKPTIKQISTPTIKNEPSLVKKITGYKRSCKLNLKSSTSFDVTKSLDSNDKSKANEKIYKFIDLFSVSESILNEFNKATTCEKLLTTNVNANNVCIQNISQQLNNLLEFISYKSETSTILNDLFSANNINSTGSSSSSFVSHSSLVLVIERVEFVSKQLNDELVKLIKYCLNVSLKDGLVISKPNQLQLTLSNDYFKKFHTNSTQTKPATMISIVDLLCLSFDVCYSLFLFRAKFLHSQNELNKKKLLTNKLIRSNANTSSNEFIYSTLIKLKQDFFKLIVIFLKSINFSSTITTNTKTNKPTEVNANKSETTCLSASSTSYSTLKILNSIMDCFNHLIYLPVLNKQLEPDSILTIFYFSLIDNMHNIFKNNKFNKLIELNDQQEMEQDVDEEDCSNEYEDDDEPCLFKLFYEKLIKYFGEIVYSLELNETNEALTQNDESNESNQISIITTIAADDETAKLTNDFSTDKVTPPNKLTTSKSQNDLIETLQSQTPLDDDWKQKFDFNTSNVNMNSCQLQDANNTTSNKCIHLLQTQLLSNFLHYLHNCELFSSFENRFINQSEQFKSCYLKSSNSNECLCYKDLLSSFLILIDYQFNEKFISGAKLNIQACFWSSISSYCLMSPKLANTTTRDDLVNSFNLDELKSLASNSNCYLNEKTNRFLFILIMRCCNALISLFNRTHPNADDKKTKFFESIKDDYRIKNFYCLFTLIDSNCEEFLNKTKSLDEQKPRVTHNQVLQAKNEFNHLYSSLNSLRTLFKTYMDDYFDLD